MLPSIKLGSVAATFGAVILFFSVIAVPVGYIGRVADHGAIVGILNDDAANAIQVTLRSQWWRNNDFMPYGPVYFRLANSMRQLVPWSGDYKTGTLEAREAGAHFSMLLLSLLATVGIAGVLAGILTNLPSCWIAFTTSLTAALLHDPIWSRMLLTAHPDLLFAFILGVAWLVTLEALRRSADQRWFKAAAVMWGVAASTKLTIVLFVPAFLFLWGFPWRRENARTLGRFVLWALIGFLVVGFPQNFLIPKMLKFLHTQSHLSVRPGLKDILDWGYLFVTQMRAPLAVLAVGAFLLPRRRGNAFIYVPRDLARASLLIVIPTLWLVSRKVLSPYDYYPMPFVTLLLVFFALMLRRWSSPLGARWPLAGMVALIGLVRIWPQFTPPAMANEAEQMEVCRTEGRLVYDQIQNFLAHDRIVYVDPYVPSPTAPNLAIVRSWAMNRRDFAGSRANIAVLRSRFYSRYLAETPSDYVKQENPNWKESQSFYRLFSGKSEVSDAEIGKWKRIYQDACQLEIWERLIQ